MDVGDQLRELLDAAVISREQDDGADQWMAQHLAVLGRELVPGNVDHQRAQGHFSSDLRRSLQHCDGLDVCRVRKHVDHAGGAQAETVFVDEHAQIPRQTARVARDIHDAARITDARRAPKSRLRPPAAGRSARGRSRRAAHGQVRAGDRQIGHVEFGVLRCRSIRHWRRARPTSAASPSTPTTGPARRASGQREIADPAEQVQHRVGWLQLPGARPPG